MEIQLMKVKMEVTPGNSFRLPLAPSSQRELLPRPTKSSSPIQTALPKKRSASVTASFKPVTAMASAANEGGGSPEFDVEGFQKEFEQRFKLPHLTDVLDVKPIPSTFCVKSSCPVPDEDLDDSQEDLRKMFVHNDDRVLLKVIKFANPTSAGSECVDPGCNFVHQWVHRAGPRTQIYFEPSEVKAAIVTCGGLCPGLNDVIRQIVITLDVYGVKNIMGIRHGFRGITDENIPELQLTRDAVQTIHLGGGSVLGVSRGGSDVSEIVDSIEKQGYNMLFVLGGDGTHKGGNAIHNECRRRKMKVVVVGVPKTIDNDILLMDKTFGFDTAVEEAQRAISAAYVEAHSAYRGVGIVKLMGRSSGFIAMHASLASGQIDVCLIPEVRFKLEGPDGLLQHLENLLESQGAAVICAAEGAGQDFFEKSNATDPSGNPVLGDIGVFLHKKIKSHFQQMGKPADVKYIDPTYMIRACRANAADGILCTVLGQNAVHGAFAGFSGITVGICNTHYVYFPIPEVTKHPRHVDPNSRMWHRCLTSTGQPDFQ